MNKFEFLIGEWIMEYHVPKSSLSPAMTGTGRGVFKRALNDQYVYFDYQAQLEKVAAAAHAVFAWDKKLNIYRFWWFEDSGAFMTATCNFVDDHTLMLNWHETLLIQSFELQNQKEIVLRMEYPKNRQENELVLQVRFNKL
jgi:hypothetical protein